MKISFLDRATLCPSTVLRAPAFAHELTVHERTAPAEVAERIADADIVQEIYGVPDYLSSINAVLLNEAATLFRRRYYKNGAHAGFILHITDAMKSQKDVDDHQNQCQKKDKSV